MIAIIDYGAGNLRSVANAFRRLGADVQTVSDPAALAHAEKIVLPGVGAFGAGMARLREAGFVEPLREAARAGTPLLGICLGLHYLFERSDEMGRHAGLGLLPGHVTPFPSCELKVPHVGWNALHRQQEHPVMAGIPDGAYAYFVHSYYVQTADPAMALATTEYGIRFASVVGPGSIIGLHPHLEHTQPAGIRAPKNSIH